MDLLQVQADQIVDASGLPVHLRGVCVGGWMNMENFIDGYPGAEHGLREAMADTLGPAKAGFFFDRLLDYFLAEEDFAFLKSLGATVVRLPLNYRHFERDSRPFQYLESGFTRLDRALDSCARHGLYAILDLHAIQGCQNPDWHSDNASRAALFWEHPHFQDRFVALWESFARRYAGNPAVAGYNLMNEPVTKSARGRSRDDHPQDWGALNRIYRRAVAAIRAIDPNHIIFLDGDLFASRFSGLEAPFAPNLVYDCRGYNAAGFGPGPYPGHIGGQRWDLATQRERFLNSEGMQFALQHRVPLWVGEFGSIHNGPVREIPDRLCALDDLLSVFMETGVHWTAWTYKDVGVMGWMSLDPECEYLQRLAPVLEAKRLLDVDFWMSWLPPTPAKKTVARLAKQIIAALGDRGMAVPEIARFLGQAALDNYAGGLLQPVYAKTFQGLSEPELDRILQGFAFQNCRPQPGLVEVFKKYLLG